MDSRGRNGRWWLPLALLTTLCLALASGAWADEPPVYSDYAKQTDDGVYTFVMFVPQDNPFSRGPNEVLRATYPTSGMYATADPQTPLWTIDWFAEDVWLLGDKTHIIRWGPWPAIGSYDELALAFYADGSETARYTVSDLISAPQLLPESVSHYDWLRSRSLDSTTGELVLETEADTRLVFDAVSGELIEWSAGLSGWGTAVGLAILLLVTLGFWFFRRKGLLKI